MTTILVPGRTGQLGGELQTALAPHGKVVAFDRGAMDLASPDSVRRAIRDTRPDIIVNAAAYTLVDKAEAEPDLALRVNGIAPGIMAEEAKRLGAILIHYSTDYVFDGGLDRPYVEDDAPNPLNVYGKTKLAGEIAVEAVGGSYLILRSSWVYGARGGNFVLTILRRACEQAELSVVNDQTGSPTWARRLADATAELLQRRELVTAHSGVYHLCASGHTSRFELATAIIRIMAEVSGVTDGWARVNPVSSGEYPLPATRPRKPVMSQDKIQRVFGVRMTRWEEQLRAFIAEIAGGTGPCGKLSSIT